jgi:hypothetical protein
MAPDLNAMQDIASDSAGPSGSSAKSRRRCMVLREILQRRQHNHNHLIIYMS